MAPSVPVQIAVPGLFHLQTVEWFESVGRIRQQSGGCGTLTVVSLVGYVGFGLLSDVCDASSFICRQSVELLCGPPMLTS